VGAPPLGRLGAAGGEGLESSTGVALLEDASGGGTGNGTEGGKGAETGLGLGDATGAARVSSMLCTCRVQSCEWSTKTTVATLGRPGKLARIVQRPSESGV